MSLKYYFKLGDFMDENYLSELADMMPNMKRNKEYIKALFDAQNVISEFLKYGDLKGLHTFDFHNAFPNLDYDTSEYFI